MLNVTDLFDAFLFISVINEHIDCYTHVTADVIVTDDLDDRNICVASIAKCSHNLNVSRENFCMCINKFLFLQIYVVRIR